MRGITESWANNDVTGVEVGLEKCVNQAVLQWGILTMGIYVHVPYSTHIRLEQTKGGMVIITETNQLTM